MTPFLRWEEVTKRAEWRLLAGRSSTPRNVATVWRNLDSRFTWHTWDRGGAGGENDVSDTLEEAQALASLCAIRQGFI